jgi:3-(3-hydroxy-phenyl)propionate hydroxylase
MTDADVVISGGGPVGLCLALLLARGGARVLVLEADAALARDLRASTFHPPTLDMLDTLGLTPALLAQGLVCPHWQVRMHPSGDRAVFDLSVLDGETTHPYRLQCEQWKLSDALLAALGETGAEIRFATRLETVSQDGDGVTVAATGPDGPATLRARFCVGADGARSAVRAAMGLSLEGETFPETTILATTTFPFEDHLEGLSNVSYCWKGGGNFSLLKVPGRWRVSIYPREDASLESQLAPSALQSALREIVPDEAAFDLGEVRPYRIHQRIVPAYVQGRLALAGDAAHLNSPVGGMGLNGGLHDAFALAQALLGVLDGALLDSLQRYDRRRRPVAAEEILAQSGRNRARMRTRDPGKRREILADLQAITRDPDRLRDHLLRTSMIAGLRRAEAVP